MIERSVLAIVLACTASAAPAQPAFSSRTEAVRVDALVTDHGAPVVGLGRDDFEILDNGVPQQVDLISFEQIPLNVILTLDMSDSVAGDPSIISALPAVLRCRPCSAAINRRWSRSVKSLRCEHRCQATPPQCDPRWNRRRAPARPRSSTASSPA